MLAALPAVLLLIGCDRSCRSDFRCWPLGVSVDVGGAGGGGGTEAGGAGGGPVCPEDPADDHVAEACGVWVSASMGDDANEGTQLAPVKTIGAAITLAAQGSFRIYACGEEYVEAVELPSGTSLFGGFDCVNGWSYAGTVRRATVKPTIADVVPLILLAGDRRSLLRDINVTALDAAHPGGSSIAIFAMPDSKADIQRADISPGNGADGEDGEDGNHDALPAFSGLSGKPGENACTMNPASGGAAVLLACPDGTISASGEGGHAGELAANGGGDGLPIPAANPQGLGLGGEGENVPQSSSCTPGLGGAPGADGSNGLGAAANGRLTISGYIGTMGGGGKGGAPGQGGGGGGGSVGKVSCGAAPHGGASGGSGGTGGCGGRAGKGGQPGGSSLGIASLSPGIFVTNVRFLLGNGGKGGNGGAGQPGGQGGLPALGGAGVNAADPVKPGCAGGAGGYGGNGGNGGGGQGGHSLGTTGTKGNVPSLANPYDYTFGQIGAGGLGGDQASIEQLGKDGTASTQMPLDP